jgi:hypothetical protein
MAKPILLLLMAGSIVVIAPGCSTLLGLAIAPQATVAAAAAATTGAVADAVIGQPSLASQDIDRILRNNPDIDQDGTLRDLQKRLPPDPVQPSGGFQDRAVTVRQERLAEHDRHVKPGTAPIGSDILVSAERKKPSPRGLRLEARSHPDGDDLPRWERVSYTMDVESVRFDR